MEGQQKLPGVGKKLRSVQVTAQVSDVNVVPDCAQAVLRKRRALTTLSPCFTV